ncbi:MAG TPA: ubiquinol-cytochrome C chaperone family protein [Allosphingosinicella sp.]
MSFLQRIFSGGKRRETLQPLYRAVVAAARNPGWYRDGQVPDTLDGRFDVLAALLALVLLRLEKEGDPAREASVLLTELFIADMEATLRQVGIGDYVVGKHVGRMTSALGGRLSAFRVARDAREGFEEPVRRNLFHDAAPSPGALRWAAANLERFHRRLEDMEARPLIAGQVPPL